MSDIDHTRDCILPSDGRAEGLVRASELFALAAERDALRAEIERLGRDYNTARDAHDRRVRELDALCIEVAALRAEVEKLRKEDYRLEADAAIALLRPVIRAEALEEAAKVCDAMEEEAERRARKMYNGDMWLGESAGCAKAAAAIRALIPKEPK